MPKKFSILSTNRISILLFCLSTIAGLAAQFLIITPAQACEREGQTYSPGDTVGPYICMPDGSWQPR